MEGGQCRLSEELPVGTVSGQPTDQNRSTPEVQHGLDRAAGVVYLSQQRGCGPCTPGLT